MEKKINSNSTTNSTTVSRLRLSTSTPIQALGVKAERAACIAEAARKFEPRREASKKPRRPQKPIDFSMGMIKKAVEKFYGDTMKIVWEKPQRFSVAHSSVKLFSKQALAMHEIAMNEWIVNGRRKEEKPKDVNPDCTFVFYASHHRPDKLDSAALYCNDAVQMASEIKERGSFMTVPVKEVRIEEGRRAFVDVSLM